MSYEYIKNYNKAISTYPNANPINVLKSTNHNINKDDTIFKCDTTQMGYIKETNPYTQYMKEKAQLNIQYQKYMLEHNELQSSNNQPGQESPYNYVNLNENNENNYAPQSYIGITNIVKVDYAKGNGAIPSTSDVGILPTQGNKVSTTQTFISWLLNNNKNSTAYIANTTPQELAHYMFKAADNIQRVDADHLEYEIVNGKKQYILRDITNSKNVDKVNLDYQFENITPGDGVVTTTEATSLAIGIASDAETNVRKSILAQTHQEEAERTSSARTVKYDKNDPFREFIIKASELDGVQGLTEQELATAIEKVAIQKDGGLYFSYNKLQAYLQDKHNDQ